VEFVITYLDKRVSSEILSEMGQGETYSNIDSSAEDEVEDIEEQTW
jgi:CheY-specific phosphatase CheX